MHDDTVQEIVALEQKIKTLLEAERSRLASALSSYTRDIEEELASYLETLQCDESTDKAKARSIAESEAKEILARAEAERSFLAAISDEQLRELLGKHLRDILPESV